MPAWQMYNLAAITSQRLRGAQTSKKQKQL
jgi:hypothetical protein